MAAFRSAICHFPIATILLFPLAAKATLVGTDSSIATATELANRDKVRDFLNRENVASQLQRMGIPATSADARVVAMTQDEINRLAGQIDTMPAGAMASGWWWAI